MEELKTIIIEVNQKLKSEIFSLKDENTIWNQDNREECDIDMTFENDVYELRMTGITERYNTIEDAIQGLIDMYG